MNASEANCTDEFGELVHCNATCVETVTDSAASNLALNIFMTVIYTVIFITGFLGNVVTCLVISRNRHMQTATNYYLFSLAISDLLFLILGFPDEMNKTWSPRTYLFGPVFCWLRGLGAETCANASILIIVAFTVERWIALCHPFSRAHHGGTSLGRVAKTICGFWVLGLVFAIPQVARLGIVQEFSCDGRPIPDRHVCSIDPEYNNYARYAFQASTFLLFVLPMLIISFLYIRICISLAKSETYFEGDRKLSYRSNASRYRNRGGADGASGGNGTTEAVRLSSTVHRAGAENSKANVIKLLVAVVVVFFICWAPFHAQRLLAIYGDSTNFWHARVYEILDNISGVLYYFSATVNPILYHILCARFRSAFKDTLGCCKGSEARPFIGVQPSRINGVPPNQWGRETASERARRGTCVTAVAQDTKRLDPCQIPMAQFPPARPAAVL